MEKLCCTPSIPLDQFLGTATTSLHPLCPCVHLMLCTKEVPYWYGLSKQWGNWFFNIVFFHLQDLFHQPGHWLQAGGIWKHHLEPYMTRQPLHPLPRQREGEGLKPIQLVMLWIVWAIGLTIALLTFLFELVTRGKEERLNDVIVMKNQNEVPRKVEYPALNVPVKGDSEPVKRNEDSKPTTIHVMEYNDYDENAIKAFDFEMK